MVSLCVCRVMCVVCLCFLHGGSDIIECNTSQASLAPSGCQPSSAGCQPVVSPPGCQPSSAARLRLRTWTENHGRVLAAAESCCRNSIVCLKSVWCRPRPSGDRQTLRLGCVLQTIHLSLRSHLLLVLVGDTMLLKQEGSKVPLLFNSLLFPLLSF